jgi:hypothetical protein
MIWVPSAINKEVDEEASAVEFVSICSPQACAMYESQSFSELPVRCITVPQGSVPIMRPGYPHFELHLEMQSLAVLYF